MKLTNYHTHSLFCDGKDTPEAYVLEAIERGMYAIGFSGHSPVPFYSDWNMKPEDLPLYIYQIRRLKEKYGRQIRIFQSMETDYIPDVCGLGFFGEFQFDYTLESVHYLSYFSNGSAFDFDESPARYLLGLEQVFEGDIRKMVADYYSRIRDMVATDRPQVIGHLDLITKFNKELQLIDEQANWYQDEIAKTLQIVKQYGSIVEINTRGRMKNLSDWFYPAPAILQKCVALDIPITLSADAHKPTEVDSLLRQAAEHAQEIGFKNYMLFDEKGWTSERF